MLIAWQYIDGKLYDQKCAEGFSTLFSDPDRIEDAKYTVIHRIVLGLSSRDLRKELQWHPDLIDAQDVDGQTALSWAAARDDVENVLTLLEHGANPNFRMGDGVTPLHQAASAHASARSMLALLDHGADVTQLSLRGYTAMHLVAGEGNGADYVQPLMEAGIDINVRSKVGATALAVAANKPYPDSVEALLTSGADPEIPLYRDPFLTPLGLTVRLNRHRNLEILLAAGASYRMVGENGDTILHRVAMGGDHQTMQILTRHALSGIPIDKRNSTGKTAQGIFESRREVSGELRQAWERLVDSVRGNEDVDMKD